MPARFQRLTCRAHLLLFSALLVGLPSGCMTMNQHSAVSAKQLGLNHLQLHRLKKFVDDQDRDKCDFKRTTYIKAYSYSPEVVSAHYIGLIAVSPQNSSHSSTMFFVNGRHRITPLDLKLTRCGAADYVTSIDTTAEKGRQVQVVETALRRYARELPDSLQQQIRQYFQFFYR
ncbi:hypothetical protein [Hymenobacter terrestris]|uniref:Lipoprotein n=1 Tax=Hymenobacter terrestris TaxID=2748310 RepID=A0ABX2Q3T2_9BACT|nr:hypothetical protein [Hymenobacter terrestris]NVO85608.1 hypothetical protein [Hymenobacter terrestris]